MKRELFLDREAVQEQVKKLADQISTDYEGKDLILIGVLKGAVFFFTDLVRQISTPVKIDFIRAASYGSGLKSSGLIQITKDVEIPINGKSVILVEDIVDTGLTLNRIIKELGTKGPKSVKICALIDKYERRETDVTVDYRGFKVEEGFFVGYGLDHDENFRQLPDIYVLK